MYKRKVEQIELEAREWNMRELNPRELNAKQACVHAFIVSDKVCIVKIVTSDLSDVIILININLLIQGAFLHLYTRLQLTHTE